MKKNFGLWKLAAQIGIGALFVIGGLENLPVTLLIILVSTVLAGPIFCGWVCPFGTLQDLVSRLTKGIKKRRMPKGLQTALAFSRYFLLAATGLLTTDWIFNLMALDARINLLSIFSGNILTIGAYGVMAAYLVIAVFYERPFCSHMCPQGAKYGLIGSLRPFRVCRDESACVNCRKCNQVCPMHIDIMGHKNVTSLQCISCMNCVAACPKKGALKFGIIKLSKKGLAAYFAAVIIAVGAVTGFAAYQYTTESMAITAAEEEAMATVQTEVSETFGSDADTGVNEVVQSADTAAVAESSNATAATSQSTSQSAPQATSKTTTPITSQSVTNTTKSSSSANTQAATKTQTASTPQTTTSQSQVTATPAAPAVVEQVASSENTGLKDGTYTGEARGFKGPVTVSVTIQNQQITSIDVIDNMDDRKWFNRALSVIDDMLAAQSADVDTVTGATYSSRGIINAAKDALSKAN